MFLFHGCFCANSVLGLPEEDFRIKDLIFMQDHLDKFLVHSGQRHGRIETNSASFFLFEVDIWRVLIQPDTNALQLFLQQFSKKE